MGRQYRRAHLRKGAYAHNPLSDRPTTVVGRDTFQPVAEMLDATSFDADPPKVLVHPEKNHGDMSQRLAAGPFYWNFLSLKSQETHLTQHHRGTRTRKLQPGQVVAERRCQDGAVWKGPSIFPHDIILVLAWTYQQPGPGREAN